MTALALTELEEKRYARQINLRQIDFDGQEKLKVSTMLIVGLGGLGCAAAQYLASAGVGRLLLLDFDKVSLSNLQRQILHSDATIGQEKVLSAKARLQEINPHITIEPFAMNASDAELAHLIAQADVVLDCTDNRDIRCRLDNVCQRLQTPLVSGAAIRMEGLISTFTYEPNTPTYHTLAQLFGEVGQSCVETGVLAPIVGVIGSLQALEAIKVRLNLGRTLCGRVLLVDGLSLQMREMTLPNF